MRKGRVPCLLEGNEGVGLEAVKERDILGEERIEFGVVREEYVMVSVRWEFY